MDTKTLLLKRILKETTAIRKELESRENDIIHRNHHLHKQPKLKLQEITGE